MSATNVPSSDGYGSARRRFGHYLLHNELGRGAQGIVHLAEDTLLGRRVALKMLTGAQSQEVRDRFQREAKITSKLNHPGICGLYEVGEAEGVPYLAMQYVPGRTLADMLKEARAQQLDERRAAQTISVTGRSSKGEMQDVIRLIERVALALHVAHENGLVHRDVKPHNIMVTPEGDPVLLDFGLARDLDTEGQTLTASGQVMGTPAYLAPEQIVADREHIDRRTDVYALGVTLFECLTLARPFDAQSWDQLYHLILQGDVPNPCKLNPRIPKDLRTVIEVAMERDQKRRYPTCKALAEDLQRVRSYEPITATAANLLVRTGKWARRRPGRAATAAAAMVLTFAGGGTVAYRAWQQQTMVTQFLAAAAERLAAGDYGGAREAVTQARTWDPDSARAVELRVEIEQREREARQRRDREDAVAAAAAARAESAQHLVRYRTARDAAVQLEGELAAERPLAAQRPEAERGLLNRRANELQRLRVEAEHCVLEASEALQRAARLEAPYGGASATTESAFADLYLTQLREAWRTGDGARTAALAAAVAKHDRDGIHRAELLGHGSLTVTVSPPSAEVFLFRFEDYATVRADSPVPRLVPVPTAGIGRLRANAWAGAFHPGDPCLAVTAVVPGSPAARAGLVPGDLVVGIDTATCTGAFVRAAHGELAAAGAAPLQQLRAVDGLPIGHVFDLALVPPRQDGTAQFAFVGGPDTVTGPRLDLEACSARSLLAAAAPVAYELHGLHDGEPVTVSIAAGATAGLDTHLTACPLPCSRGNRVAVATPLTVAPGSYLLVARAEGRETERLHVVVDRLGSAIAAMALLPAGMSPPGFVRVPAGPFWRGGDFDAVAPTARQSVDLPDFWIARFELTNAEYFEFLNDPEVQQRVADAVAARSPRILVPRDNTKDLAKQADDGRWLWDAYTATAADTPVLGLSWHDASAYVAWRNARAEAAGEAWVYPLPTADQWEKAARGVDGRSFPWGNQFDPALTVCTNTRGTYLLDAPGGYAVRDESVYGVHDLAGSREEWSCDMEPLRNPGQAPSYLKLGGSWGVALDTVFRCASRPVSAAAFATSQRGLRLVARRR